MTKTIHFHWENRFVLQFYLKTDLNMLVLKPFFNLGSSRACNKTLIIFLSYFHRCDGEDTRETER